MQSTNQKPLRFALLGAPKTSKSSITSIIVNEKSLGNYYPTLQNSPILFQFDPKNYKTRALLDINATLTDYDSLDFLGSDSSSIIISDNIIKSAAQNDANLIILPTSSNHFQNKPRTYSNNSNKSNKSNTNLNSLYMSPSSSNNNNSSVMSNNTISPVVSSNQNSHSSSHQGPNSNSNHSQQYILKRTLNYYLLDYSPHPEYERLTSGPGSYSSVFQNSTLRSPNNIHSFNVSPFLKPSSSVGSIYSNINHIRSNSISNSESDSTAYKPPVSTPILLELIDTPGILPEEIIPFLEKSVDTKLAKDIIRNLDDSTTDRSRVQTLMVGSGISDLNGSIDGYILCYSCIPDINEVSAAPPGYEESVSPVSSNDTPRHSDSPVPIPISSPHNNSDSDLFTSDAQEIPQPKHMDETIDYTPPHIPSQQVESHSLNTLKVIKQVLSEAWSEYNRYQEGWNNGKEYDIYSLNYSLKNLWKKKDGKKQTAQKDTVPPITIVCTNIDHPLASPLFIEQGKKLAKEWKCGFAEVSCKFEDWENVEECLGLAIRDSIEYKKTVLSKKVLNSTKSKK
ncbi:hypothetical protein B5S33_g3383 [[Candida] boidinii]|nr:hypothetical protein B5S30_g415 [[Candida] boidinii]OWB84731.1 hypothetical protein B5S33_g3383 [[Candida] boidinii]